MVEDDPSISEPLVAGLTRHGFEPTHVGTGAEAISAAGAADAVLLDLGLPDSMDADMTIARVANMGKYRIAVVSSMENRDQAVASAARCGANIHPHAVFKANLPFNRFIQRPESFEDFFMELMPAAGAAVPARRPARAA